MVNWVCVSDLHAGGLTSLLRNLCTDTATENAVTAAFSAALKAFLDDVQTASADKPQLVLLGDVLDLQFAKRSAATRDAIDFLQQLASTKCFSDEVIATVGNHDHSIWTEARLAMETSAVEDDREESKSYTCAFDKTADAKSGLLAAVLDKAGFPALDLRYPNIGFANDRRAVILHHGHYVEGGYRLISTIKDALCDRAEEFMSVETLTAENASWIDFAWSPFNNADELELLYQNFLTTVGFRRITKNWTEKAAAALSKALPFSGNLSLQRAVRSATKLGVEATLGRARDTERMAEVISLTKAGREGLLWYLQQPVLGQIKSEKPGFDGDVTFVLGHTHRPFSMRVCAEGFQSPVRVYNTGGWTLNGPRLDNAEGAALVLIDDQLNTASLRLFSTPRNGKVPEAEIEMLSNGHEDEDRFRSKLETSLKNTRDYWDHLREEVKRAYLERQALLISVTGVPRDAAE